MGVPKIFRGIYESVSEPSGGSKGLRVATLLVRGVRRITGVPVMQHRGLISIAKPGDVATVMQVDDLTQVIADDSKSRPSAAIGETILYADENTYVRLSPTGAVNVESKSGAKVEISPLGVILVKGLKVQIEADTVANVLAPKVGLGMDGLTGTPADQVLTCQSAQCLLLAIPHVGGSPSVFAAPIPTPAVGP